MDKKKENVAILNTDNKEGIMRNKLFLVGVILLISTSFQSLVGVLSNTIYQVDTIINVYGESIELYGIGIYRYDSLFKATIFKGTDLAMLIVVLPLFFGLLYFGVVKQNKYIKLLLLGLSSFLLYFHTSVATGVFYNQLHIVYIFNFSLSLLFIIMLYKNISESQIKADKIFEKPKAIIIYLGFNLLALIMAWIPEIISTMLHNTGLSFGHHYTTEATHVLDVGVIIPLIIITIIFLCQKNSMTLVLTPILIIMSGIIGIVIVMQTGYQLSAGIVLTNQEIATKVIPFLINSIYSFIILRYYLKRIEITA